MLAVTATGPEPEPTAVASALDADLVRSERAFRAMGSDAHVFVWQERGAPNRPEDVLDRAELEIERLEQQWSRFRTDSDLSRLNAAAGTPVPVAPETAALLEFCRQAMDTTDGQFDPSVLPALLAAGYDRSFDELTPDVVGATGTDGRLPSPGPAPAFRRRALDALVIDGADGTAMIPAGSAIDLGGVGKGRAADLVTQILRDEEGVRAACVNLGGDLRAVGAVPGPDGLVVGVADPFRVVDHLALLRVDDAGVATTARTRRHWQTDAGPMHHLIDPISGAPAHTGLASVTVVAPTGADAEVLAKALFLSGGIDAERWLTARGASALLVGDDGELRTIGDLPEV